MRCEYVDHMGDDLRVVNAARVSFDKESDICDDGSLCEKDKRLIRYLASHGHWTPFSQPQITLRITVPIFVARQDFKHQVGFTRNEVSRRYVDDKPKFFFPEKWRSRPDASIKQGSGGEIENSQPAHDIQDRNVIRALQDYEDLLALGVAPEQARMVLPQSMYTSYYTTGSLAAWARAYNLRVSKDAQKEIQDLYLKIGAIIDPLFPVSWNALTTTQTEGYNNV